jgi:hypothetical protein
VASAADSAHDNDTLDCVVAGEGGYEALNHNPSVTNWDETGLPAGRNLLPDVWAPACGVALLIYVGTLALARARWGAAADADDAATRPPPLQDAKYGAADPAFAWVSELFAVAFLASAARNAGALSFLRRDSAQASVVLCVVLINCVAAHAHWLMAYNKGPVYDSCFGRKMQVSEKPSAVCSFNLCSCKHHHHHHHHHHQASKTTFNANG